MSAPSHSTDFGHLMQVMLSHRELVFRQVSGHPQNAVGALLKKIKGAIAAPGFERIDWRLKREDGDIFGKVDRVLVDDMVRQGFISHPHAVKQVDQNETGLGPHALPLPGGAGTVVMASNRLGEFEANPNLPAEPDEIARQWSGRDGTKKVYERWFILFHELAHCDYPSLPNPFRPTPGRHDRKFVQAMNRWLFGPLGPASYSTRSLLNEGHSDALAAMVLIRVSQGDPRAVEVVEEMMRARIRSERKVAAKIAKNLHKGAHQRGDFVDEHCTGAVLYKLLKERERWESASPGEVRDFALQYASDGLLERFSVPHPLGKFYPGLSPELKDVPVSKILSEILVTPMPNASRLVPAMFGLWYIEGSGESAKAWLSTQDQKHPLLPIITQAFEDSQVRSCIPKAREIYDKRREKDAFAKALIRGDSWLTSQMLPEIERILKDVCVAENPAWCQAQEVYQADMAIIRQTFGLSKRDQLPQLPIVVPRDVQGIQEIQKIAMPRRRGISM